MGRFAEGTTVGPDKTQGEIADTLRRYGATDHLSGESGKQIIVCFRLRGHAIRMVAALPQRQDPKFHKTGRGKRTPRQAENAYQAELRRKWRSLLLRLKAKLEAVADEEVTVEEEFLAYLLVGKKGQTVWEQLAPQLAAAPSDQPLLLEGPKGDA